MTRSTLPLDVFYHIIEELEGDPTTLRQIALTNRSLLSCARLSLYHSITVSNVGFPRADLLSRTLGAAPELGALVKSLKISGIMRGVPLTPKLLPFHLLPSLNTLYLHSLALRQGSQGIDDLIAIVGSLPRLETLLCDMIMQYRQDLELDVYPRPPHFPVLRELVFIDGNWSHWTFATQLLLSYPRSLDQLERVTISFPSRSSAHSLSWIPLIRAASPRVRVVNIPITDTSMRVRYGTAELSRIAGLDAYRNDHTYVMDSLSHCPALQTLKLDYHSDRNTPTGTAQSDGPIEALCEVLERTSPPWPCLQHLELWLVDQDGVIVAMSDTLCARLASAVTDKARYPRFTTLVLRIKTQCWNERAEVWYTSSLSSESDRAAVVERWKRAFNAVRRAPGVVLDVAVSYASNRRGW